MEKKLQEHNIPTTYIRMGWFQVRQKSYSKKLRDFLLRKWAPIRQNNFTNSLINSSQENIVTYHAEEVAQGMYVDPVDDSQYTQVSVEDIGEAAATVLLDPKNHVGKTYLLTGPRALGGEDVAKVLTDVLGRPIQFVNPSLEETQQALQAMQMGALQIKMTLELYEIIRLGLAKHISHDFTALTGKQYLTVEERFKQLKQSGLLQ